MKNTNKTTNQDYLNEIMEYYDCSKEEAVKLALFIGFHEMHFDVIHDLTLLLSLNRESMMENQKTFAKMYAENPQFFPNIRDYQTSKLC